MNRFRKISVLLLTVQFLLSGLSVFGEAAETLSITGAEDMLAFAVSVNAGNMVNASLANDITLDKSTVCRHRQTHRSIGSVPMPTGCCNSLQKATKI